MPTGGPLFGGADVITLVVAAAVTTQLVKKTRLAYRNSSKREVELALRPPPGVAAVRW